MTKYKHNKLYASYEFQDQMKDGLLLNVVVRKGSSILKLIIRKKKYLIACGDTINALNYVLNILN